VKAIVCTRYGPPEVLELAEVEEPTPRSGEVRIKTFATAVTASDCIIRGFKVPVALRLPMALAIGFGRPRNPILGMIVAGEVESIGQGVQHFAPGDQVYAFNTTRFGGYAEYACLPESSVLASKPATVTYEDAAALPFGGLIALHFLRKSGLQRGMKALIYGASGAVGTAAVQLATSFGATVTGVCSTQNLDLVRSLGADTVLDYTAENVSVGDTRYDVVFDAVGKRKRSAFKEACRQALAPGGRYISVDDGSPRLRTEDLRLLTELVEAGTLRAVIDKTYPLEQMVEAHRYVEQGHKRGNVIIRVDHS
jgi:NADPH:quinone reductase-like Zn-dependent oxidoreductase